MLKRYIPLWIGMPVFGLAVGLPILWAFSQFHRSLPGGQQRVEAAHAESFWDKLLATRLRCSRWAFAS
jgi:hypothetical protein